MPKTTLVVFKDGSTCILSTKYVRKIIGKSDGDRLKEGVRVIIDYEGKDFKAAILKLHGMSKVL